MGRKLKMSKEKISKEVKVTTILCLTFLEGINLIYYGVDGTLFALVMIFITFIAGKSINKIIKKLE